MSQPVRGVNSGMDADGRSASRMALPRDYPHHSTPVPCGSASQARALCVWNVAWHCAHKTDDISLKGNALLIRACVAQALVTICCAKNKSSTAWVIGASLADFSPPYLLIAVSLVRSRGQRKDERWHRHVKGKGGGGGELKRCEQRVCCRVLTYLKRNMSP